MPSEFLAVMEPLAKHFFGAPNPALSSEHELRYGSRGSMSVDLRKGTFYDHEACEGGGVLDLVSRETRLIGADRLDWLKSHGFVWETHVGNGAAAPRASIVATYDYCDEDGVLLSQVCRFQPKDFRQRCSDGNGGWIWSVKGVRRVPYRLPELLKAGDRVVFVVEGERDADRLWRLGVPATCNIGGAGKWKPELNEFFRGGDVVVISDRDQAGQNHAAAVARALGGIAARVRVLELWRDWPEMPMKGDVSDWIGWGGTAERLYRLAAECALYLPTGTPNINPVLPLILTAEQFLQGFRPPDYLVDGMIQKSYLYSLTARTGHGKTAVVMLAGTAIARGVPFHGRPTEQGGVLFCAGENPDDIRARYFALADHEGFDPYGIPFYFIDGVINIEASLPRIRDEVAKIPNLSLIIIDTAAAYFHGDDTNSNDQQGKYARLFRELTKLPAKPAVIVNCHPIKNASQDNLVPMGGSWFLNEVDANMTLWADDKTCALAPHPDKWRGVRFESLPFELRETTTDCLKDTKGRHMPSVIAVAITEEGAARREAVADEDEKTVLRLFHAEKNASLAIIARNAGWLWPNGQPAKSKVVRVRDRLLKDKFLYKFHKEKCCLTKKGCKLIGAKHEDNDGD